MLIGLADDFLTFLLFRIAIGVIGASLWLRSTTRRSCLRRNAWEQRTRLQLDGETWEAESLRW